LATARITRWKLQLREQAAQIFAEAPAALPAAPVVEPLDVGFCLQALADALRVAPVPHIFDSDRGSQFTSQAYEQALLAATAATAEAAPPTTPSSNASGAPLSGNTFTLTPPPMATTCTGN